MEYLDLSLTSPQANLACDEALLDLAEEGLSGEVLRFWESSEYFVVVGYSNKISREVKVDSCESDNISILRRPSGGGTVLQGPGCLNYSLILSCENRPECSSITSTNRFVMDQQKIALQSVLPNDILSVQGDTDLTFTERGSNSTVKKFSGNAQRRKKKYCLFHGTFLWQMDLSKVAHYLAAPSKAPAYRNDRGHLDFVMNLPCSPTQIRESLTQIWKAQDAFANVDRLKSAADMLVREKYATSLWNLKF